jgi:diguanylate cyclase (GGDEF)-like protein
MIKLGLREAAVDAALRPFADEVLALLIELLAAYKESGDAELLATLDDHRRELAAATDPEAIPTLAGSCLETARAAVARARERQAQQHAELARFVALVRDTVTVLGGEGDDPSTAITKAADRFSDLLTISDVSQLKRRLTQEVLQLRTLAEERQRQWREATDTFMSRVATLERQLAGVREEASLDPLTKVGNRRHFETALSDQLRLSKRQFVVALFDLDDFKQINDTGGHQAGDRVLQEVARGLKTSTRPDDVVARIGGDEFAVLASGLTLRQAESRLRSILTQMTSSMTGTASLPRITLSCGAAECSAGDTMQSLMARADQALYDAKRKGKNRVSVKALPFIRDLLSR